MNITINKLKGALKRMDAPIFTGHLNVNLIGVRSEDNAPNQFNDVLCVMIDDAEGKTQLLQFPITTDPGQYYLEHPINVAGTAILMTGHYRRCWRIGAHRGQYKALVQRGLMTVYRDNNRNALIDPQPEKIQTGYFGINLHHAAPNGYTLKVGKWSAGCQVFQNVDDFYQVMDLVEQSANLFGPEFSYTLLDEFELK